MSNDGPRIFIDAGATAVVVKDDGFRDRNILPNPRPYELGTVIAH